MNIIDNNNLLTPVQKDILQDCVKMPFQLEEFESLDDILTKLGVNVIIEPGIKKIPVPQSLIDALNYWKQEYNRLRQQNDPKANEVGIIVDNISLEIGQYRLGANSCRGEYLAEKKIIKLYPDEMQTKCNGTKMDELLVSTLAHETMHAYFDRPKHNQFPYVYCVEEPLAEFGMLLYLHETASSYYDWAYNDVDHKTRTCYCIGAKLMSAHIRDKITAKSNTLRNYLENFKISLNSSDVISIDSNNNITISQNQTIAPTITISSRVLETVIGMAKIINNKNGTSLNLLNELKGMGAKDYTTGYPLFCLLYAKQIGSVSNLKSLLNEAGYFTLGPIYLSFIEGFAIGLELRKM